MRHRLPLFLACLALCLPSAAQERSYAIVSLVGDGLLIVQREMSTGSRIDRNRRELMAIANPVLDNTMVLAIDDGMHAADRSVKTLLLGVRDPNLFALQSRNLEAGQGLATLLQAVAPIARKSGATHLVLAAKYSDEARLKVADGSVGAGRIEGLGFYLDESTRLENRQDRANSLGFIAPFAFFSLTLVDLASGAVVGQEIVRESQVASTRQAQTPWTALTGEQKIRMLQDMIHAEVARAVPALLAKGRS
jgi:hypothetical protein